MTCSRTRRSAPPTTASAMPPSPMAAGVQRSVRASRVQRFSDIFSSIFGEFMDPRGQRQNAARGADLRYDIELSLEEAFTGVERTVESNAMATCEKCHGRGCARPKIASTTCRACNGMGKVRAQQGFFVVERELPAVRRRRRDDQRSVPNCHGEGRAVGQAQAVGRAFRRGRRRHPHPRGRRRRSGVRGAASGDLYLFVHMKRHPIFAREGTHAGRRLPDQLHHRRARRIDRAARDRRPSDRDQDSRRHPVGRAIAPPRLGHERGQRARARRHGGANPGRNPDPAEQGAEGLARRNSATPRRATNAPQPRASSAACATCSHNSCERREAR